MKGRSRSDGAKMMLDHCSGQGRQVPGGGCQVRLVEGRCRYSVGAVQCKRYLDGSSDNNNVDLVTHELGQPREDGKGGAL